MTTDTQQPKLDTPSFFLEEIECLLGQFAAAQDMDNWDLARAAFLAMSQNAWAAHVILTDDKRLRCPALPVEPEHDVYLFEVD